MICTRCGNNNTAIPKCIHCDYIQTTTVFLYAHGQTCPDETKGLPQYFKVPKNVTIISYCKNVLVTDSNIELNTLVKAKGDVKKFYDIVKEESITNPERRKRDSYGDDKTLNSYCVFPGNLNSYFTDLKLTIRRSNDNVPLGQYMKFPLKEKDHPLEKGIDPLWKYKDYKISTKKLSDEIPYILSNTNGEMIYLFIHSCQPIQRGWEDTTILFKDQTKFENLIVNIYKLNDYILNYYQKDLNKYLNNPIREKIDINYIIPYTTETPTKHKIEVYIANNTDIEKAALLQLVYYEDPNYKNFISKSKYYLNFYNEKLYNIIDKVSYSLRGTKANTEIDVDLTEDKKTNIISTIISNTIFGGLIFILHFNRTKKNVSIVLDEIKRFDEDNPKRIRTEVTHIGNLQHEKTFISNLD